MEVSNGDLRRGEQHRIAAKRENVTGKGSLDGPGLCLGGGLFDGNDKALRRCLAVGVADLNGKGNIGLHSIRRDGAGISELESAVEATGMNQFFAGALGRYWALTGGRSDAINLLKKMNGLANQRYISAYWLAVIHGSLGENDEAFRLLDIAFEERTTLMPYLKVAPFFDSIRHDRRFEDLLHRMNFPP